MRSRNKIDHTKADGAAGGNTAGKSREEQERPGDIGDEKEIKPRTEQPGLSGCGRSRRCRWSSGASKGHGSDSSGAQGVLQSAGIAWWDNTPTIGRETTLAN